MDSIKIVVFAMHRARVVLDYHSYLIIGVHIRLYPRLKLEVDASSIEHLEYWAGGDYYNRH